MSRNEKINQQMRDTLRRAVADGVVKVGIPAADGTTTEWCWAKRVSKNHAKLMNCCVFGDGPGYGDIVEFREQPDGPHKVLKDFVRVVSTGSRQCEFIYATDDEVKDRSPALDRELLHRLQAIRETLDQLPEDVRPICLEGLVPGMGCAAFPEAVAAPEAELYLAACPFVIAQHAGQ
jgi:hypothetical protein